MKGDSSPCGAAEAAAGCGSKVFSPFVVPECCLPPCSSPDQGRENEEEEGQTAGSAVELAAGPPAKAPAVPAATAPAAAAATATATETATSAAAAAPAAQTAAAGAAERASSATHEAHDEQQQVARILRWCLSKGGFSSIGENAASPPQQGQQWQHPQQHEQQQEQQQHQPKLQWHEKKEEALPPLFRLFLKYSCNLTLVGERVFRAHMQLMPLVICVSPQVSEAQGCGHKGPDNSSRASSCSCSIDTTSTSDTMGEDLCSSQDSPNAHINRGTSANNMTCCKAKEEYALDEGEENENDEGASPEDMWASLLRMEFAEDSQSPLPAAHQPLHPLPAEGAGAAAAGGIHAPTQPAAAAKYKRGRGNMLVDYYLRHIRLHVPPSAAKAHAPLYRVVEAAFPQHAAPAAAACESSAPDACPPAAAGAGAAAATKALPASFPATTIPGRPPVQYGNNEELSGYLQQQSPPLEERNEEKGFGPAFSYGVLLVKLSALRPQVRVAVLKAAAPFGRVLEEEGVIRRVCVEKKLHIHISADLFTVGLPADSGIAAQRSGQLQAKTSYVGTPHTETTTGGLLHADVEVQQQGQMYTRGVRGDAAEGSALFSSSDGLGAAAAACNAAAAAIAAAARREAPRGNEAAAAAAADDKGRRADDGAVAIEHDDGDCETEVRTRRPPGCTCEYIGTAEREMNTWACERAAGKAGAASPSRKRQSVTAPAPIAVAETREKRKRHVSEEEEEQMTAAAAGRKEGKRQMCTFGRWSVLVCDGKPAARVLEILNAPLILAAAAAASAQQQQRFACAANAGECPRSSSSPVSAEDYIRNAEEAAGEVVGAPGAAATPDTTPEAATAAAKGRGEAAAAVEDAGAAAGEADDKYRERRGGVPLHDRSKYLNYKQVIRDLTHLQQVCLCTAGCCPVHKHLLQVPSLWGPSAPAGAAAGDTSQTAPAPRRDAPGEAGEAANKGDNLQREVTAARAAAAAARAAAAAARAAAAAAPKTDGLSSPSDAGAEDGLVGSLGAPGASAQASPPAATSIPAAEIAASSRHNPALQAGEDNPAAAAGEDVRRRAAPCFNCHSAVCVTKFLRDAQDRIII